MHIYNLELTYLIFNIEYMDFLLLSPVFNFVYNIV